ncbi:MAG: acyl carrier protein [Bacteroidetes bacterium]|nr:acyl carrier protein [Bacteroidota bacterium]
MDKEQEKLELKQHIIKYLNLLNVTPEDIKDDMPMFGEGLGLDSIDSIELVVMLEREYGLKIENPKDGRKILQSINSMIDFIEQGRAAKSDPT